MSESLEKFIKENHVIFYPSYSPTVDKYHIRKKDGSYENELVVQKEDDGYALYARDRNYLDLLEKFNSVDSAIFAGAFGFSDVNVGHTKENIHNALLYCTGKKIDEVIAYYIKNFSDVLKFNSYQNEQCSLIVNENGISFGLTMNNVFYHFVDTNALDDECLFKIAFQCSRLRNMEKMASNLKLSEDDYRKCIATCLIDPDAINSEVLTPSSKPKQ